MTRPKLLIADDHELVAEALTRVLSPWYDVVGYVLSLDDLANRMRREPLDIVVTDLTFHDESALRVLPRLKAKYPATRFIILTASADPVLADAARKAGATAYVVKESSTVELQLAINMAIAGREYTSVSLRPRRGDGSPAKRIPTGEVAPRPTRRQLEVLQLLYVGSTHQEAADKLGLTCKTIEYHLSEAGRRLGITKTSLILRWYERYLRESGE